MVRDTGCCVIHGERVRGIAPVYNLKMKILHSYLHKKGGEKVHKAIQGDSGESGKAIVSTGSPGPKNKSCTNKTYNSYLRRAGEVHRISLEYPLGSLESGNTSQRNSR